MGYVFSVTSSHNISYAPSHRSGKENTKVRESVADSGSHHIPPKPGFYLGPLNCSR